MAGLKCEDFVDRQVLSFTVNGPLWENPYLVGTTAHRQVSQRTTPLRSDLLGVRHNRETRTHATSSRRPHIKFRKSYTLSTMSGFC